MAIIQETIQPLLPYLDQENFAQSRRHAYKERVKDVDILSLQLFGINNEYGSIQIAGIWRFSLFGQKTRSGCTDLIIGVSRLHLSHLLMLCYIAGMKNIADMAWIDALIHNRIDKRTFQRRPTGLKLSSAWGKEYIRLWMYCHIQKGLADGITYGFISADGFSRTSR